MKYRTRTYYTDAQKALMWERWKQGWTLHQVAQLFDRAHTSVRGVLAQTRGFRPPRPSTASRELRRNGGRAAYRAIDADRAAWERALGPKCCNLVKDRALAKIVTDKLRLLWSPEQIAGWLKSVHSHDESFRVSHETIYRSLFIQVRGALRQKLLQHLRRTRGMRRSRHHTQKTDI
jgi:IS30 family transposase